jgi:hypothetical protein
MHLSNSTYWRLSNAHLQQLKRNLENLFGLYLNPMTFVITHVARGPKHNIIIIIGILIQETLENYYLMTERGLYIYKRIYISTYHDIYRQECNKERRTGIAERQKFFSRSFSFLILLRTVLISISFSLSYILSPALLMLASFFSILSLYNIRLDR